MEKLQAALQTARQQREGLSPRTKPDTPRKRRASEDRDALWSALPQMAPSSETLKRHRVVAQEASSAATPFDILRTKVLLQMRQNGWKRLAITSPMPKSGKTTMACNLALGLGRQKELRSMLFDLDLRDPSIHKFFDQRAEHSIGSMLTGEVEFAEQARRVGDNLAISMSQTTDQDPTKILLSEQTSAAIDDIQIAYAPDLMIFDLPSVLVNDDSRAFLKNVDCALIVSRANMTRYSHFDVCEREISEHTNVLGVVLNACRYAGPSND